MSTTLYFLLDDLLLLAQIIFILPNVYPVTYETLNYAVSAATLYHPTGNRFWCAAIVCTSVWSDAHMCCTMLELHTVKSRSPFVSQHY